MRDATEILRFIFGDDLNLLKHLNSLTERLLQDLAVALTGSEEEKEILRKLEDSFRLSIRVKEGLIDNENK